MSIFRAVFDEITEADIDQLIADGFREGLLIEYKRDMYGNADADRREFVKDICSLANSSGGHLLIGIEEEEGLPISKAAYPLDADAALQRLENIVRASVEPRIVGVRMRAIPLAAGGHIFLIRVPKSWNPPHRVNLQGTNRFYVRSSAGAHEASVEELRVIFSGGAAIHDRLIAYRRERVARIAANDGVVPLADDHGKIILHIVPLSAFSNENQVAPSQAFDVQDLLRPMKADGWSPRINFEGFGMTWGRDPSSAYTQIFRNGIIEAVRIHSTMTYRPRPDVPGERVIPTQDLGEAILQSVPSYLRALERLEVSPPFAVMLTLVGVRGARLGIATRSFFFDDPGRISHDDLELPIQQVDAFGDSQSYKEAIAPAFDALWNAVGFPNANDFLANFDTSGRWVGGS